ncbi:MAG: HK97 family phage prohead protease, partial [Tannerella sp.]|nr:HK97 family phage prohead protease [Tannerella sp.]
LSDGKKINARGYRLNLEGGSFERFNANPVMLYMHNDGEVIGKWENLRVENDRLIADAVFDSSEKAREVERQVLAGFLKGCSIGIIIREMLFLDDEAVVNNWELMEASIVSIPSDPGAVVLYNEKREVLNFNFSNNNQKTEEKMAETTLKLSQKTVESLNLGADYTPRDVETAVAEKDREIETLNARLKAVEKQAQTDYLTAAVKSGKISETERLSLEKMAEKGVFDEVKAMIDAKPEKASATLADKVQQSNLTAGRETWDYLKWMKEDPKGLQKIKTENPKEFERLQETIKNG